jgi:hypothetical protein
MIRAKPALGVTMDASPRSVSSHQFRPQSTEVHIVKRSLHFMLAVLTLAACTRAGSPSTGGPALGANGGRHLYTIPHVLRYATAEDIVGLNPHLNQQTVLSYMSSLTTG